jgi:uncharacterized protein
MKFFNRTNELTALQTLYSQSEIQGRMSVLTGRRRVGKTMLAIEFARKHKHIYLFVSKKSEHLLCDEFLQQIRGEFELPVIGHITSFKDVFRLLLEISSKENFTLIVDEFQEFYNINPGVFSDVQHLWDSYKQKSKLNLIFIGSVYSLMNKIFKDTKEPLFNRADRHFFINAFSIQDMATILKEYNQNSIKTLFEYFVITGAMPIYTDLLVSNGAFSLDKILDFILQPNSPLLYEGKNVLVEEFGKEYSTYFSILSLIASGKTARPEIESILERNIGGYIEKLESDFAILSKHMPVNAKPGSRIVKYKIQDNFLNFWFRFIYRNMSAIEIGNFDYVKDIINRDFSTYSGVLLEKMFHQLIAAGKQYNVVGSYWDRKGENEIDVVAVNDIKKKILLAEVKLDSNKIDINKLKVKAEKLLRSYPGYTQNLEKLGLEDIEKFLK